MKATLKRADHADIFEHLRRLIPEGEVNIKVALTQLQANQIEGCLKILKDLDVKLGKFGLHDLISDKKHPGVFRPIIYIYEVIYDGKGAKFSRSIVFFSCGYVESVMKRMVRLNFFESLLTGADSLPMGTLVSKLQKELPTVLYQDLQWLSSRLYNFAKHEWDIPTDEKGQVSDHYFALDEAVAVYFIARRLANDLITLSKKPLDEFTKELPSG